MYLATSSILGYVIEKVSGVTLLQHAEAVLLPYLGIAQGEITSWNVSESFIDAGATRYGGLQATPRHLAKLAKLLEQRGVVNATTRILSAELSAAMVRNQSDMTFSLSSQYESPLSLGWAGLDYKFDSTPAYNHCKGGIASGGQHDGYGYGWWLYDSPSSGSPTCAVGRYGQFACFFETGEVMSLLMGGNQTRMEAPCHLLNQIKEVLTSPPSSPSLSPERATWLQSSWTNMMQYLTPGFFSTSQRGG